MLTVMFFSNGSTAVFDEAGPQVPELQEPYILLFSKLLEEKKIDPLQVEFIMPDQRRAKLFKTDNGYNWRLSNT